MRCRRSGDGKWGEKTIRKEVGRREVVVKGEVTARRQVMDGRDVTARRRGMGSSEEGIPGRCR